MKKRTLIKLTEHCRWRMGCYLVIEQLINLGATVELRPRAKNRTEKFSIYVSGLRVYVRAAWPRQYRHGTRTAKGQTRVIAARYFTARRDGEDGVFVFVAIGLNGEAHRFFVVPTNAVRVKGWKLYNGCRSRTYGSHENAWHHIAGSPPPA